MKKIITTECPCGYSTQVEIIMKSSPANSPFPPKKDPLTGLILKKGGGNYGTGRRMLAGDKEFITKTLLVDFYPYTKGVNQREDLQFLVCPKCGVVLFPEIVRTTEIIEDEPAAEE